jgi:hypothetical protein
VAYLIPRNWWIETFGVDRGWSTPVKIEFRVLWKTRGFVEGGEIRATMSQVMRE